MGTLIYNFNENIKISLNGGKILGVGNGNPNSHHNEKADAVTAFMGKAQIIISGDTKAITLTSGSLSTTHFFGEAK